MSKRGIFWTIFLVLAVGAGAALMIINKQATDVMQDAADAFPGGMVVYMHVVNKAPTPITFWIDESKLPKMPASTDKMPKGQKKANPKDVHYAKPVTVPGNQEADFTIAPYFKSGGDNVPITVDAGSNGKAVASGTGTVSGNAALDGTALTATWDGSNLVVTHGGPLKKPGSGGGKKGGGGGG